MDTVELYVVVGPTNVFMGGRNVPGGFEYLNRNLLLLSQLNPEIHFHVRVAHSLYHGTLGEFTRAKNMDIQVKFFGNFDIHKLDVMDPVLQHGTLLNKLLTSVPPRQRFVIFIDPDCYCVERNIISALITELKTNDLAVVGVPYPAWYPKEYSLRTPQLYFSIFDRNKIDPSFLDHRAGGEVDSDVSENSMTILTRIKVLNRLKRVIVLSNLFKWDSTFLVLFENKISLVSGRFLINPRDTAWRLADEIDQIGKKFMILPNIAKTDFRINGFNSTNYLLYNPDLVHLKGHLGWHFASTGLFEGRRLGRQGFIPTLLHFVFKKNAGFSSKWPASSLVARGNIQNSELLNYILRLIPSADFYAVKSNFGFFHLGSKGKGRISEEIQVLDSIITEILRANHL